MRSICQIKLGEILKRAVAPYIRGQLPLLNTEKKH